MGCPGLWKYTLELSLKRLPVSRIDLMFRDVFPCAKPYPDRRVRTLGRAAGVQSCEAECSLQAGLGFRSGLYHQSMVRRAATENCVKNEHARKKLRKKLGKSKLKIRQLE